MALYKDVASLEVVGYTEPKNGTFSDGVQFILEKLDAIPEADVEPVRHGKWIRHGTRDFECSKCKRLVFATPTVTVEMVANWFKHCPECGAKMDEKEKEE